MKNGGWLDTYADGGTMQEHQENYNDPQVSLPEGFVGMGNDTKGRNYSPAWGGQFQMGGNIYPVNYVPEAQMGASIPGAVGFSYARVGAPSKGPRRNQTDVTDASAQNGKEMKYYQEGLDFKPKSISKNGGWLDSYDVAQDGDFLDKFRESHPSVRSMINDAMNRKIQKNKGKGKETTVTQKDNTRTVTPKEIKKLSGKEQNELAQRQSEEQARKDYVQANMEEAYKSPLMSPGYFTPEGAAIGALQGTTKMGPDLYEGNYKGAAMDALMMLPIAIPAAKTLGRTLGTEEGLLSNAYKLNPNAERLNDINKSYRVAGLDALEDFNNTGVLRSQRILPENPTFLDRMKARPTSFPSFQKGYADLSYLPEEGGVIFETELPTFKRGQVNPVTDEVIGGRHYAHRVIDPETGRTMTEIPGSNINVYGDKPHWWKGYQQLDLPGRNYFEGPLPIIPRNNMIQSSAIDSALEKELRPYISKIGEPSISREEEVFRNVMGHEYRQAKELQNTKFLDSEGNIISAPNTSQQQFYQGDIPATDRPIQKDGGVIKDDMGQWNHPGEITEIGSNDITMKGVPYDVLGISDTGDTKLMKPGKNYKFKGKKVTEYPMAKNGLRQEQKGLVNLDQLTNFTNYNTKQPGGWLDTL
jgi:hypothetical protein